MGDIIEMTLPECTRRLKSAFEKHRKYIFFLGAGCSVSSGIDAAGTLVNRWLPELKEFQTGSDSDFEKWAADKYDYDPDKPAMIYNRIIKELFPTRSERQKEIEERTSFRDPGFGYTVLAKLMTHDIYRRNCNAVLTTNFDDMVADALYLFAQTKPLVISHESLVEFARISETRPLVFKVHGDAMLDPQNTEEEIYELSPNTQYKLRELLSETGIIFIGYGGNDKGIADFFSNLPSTALPLGVWWINRNDPEKTLLGEWFKKMGRTFWVKHQDFDELMLLIRDHFEIKNPDATQLNKLIDIYKEKAIELQKKISAKPDSENKKDLEQAMERVAADFDDWWSYQLEASKYEKDDPDEADKIYKAGIKKLPNDADMLGSYALFLTEIRKNHDLAETYYKRSLEADPNDAIYLGNYASFLRRILKNHDHAETYFKRSLDADPNHAINLGNYANFLTDIRKNHNLAETYYKRSLDADPNYAIHLGNYAFFLTDIRKNYDLAETYFKRSLDADPNHAIHLGNYANFLRNIRKNHDLAETYYKRSIDADPNHANNLGNYARLLLIDGRNDEGLKMVERSLNSNPLDGTQVECWFYKYAHDKDKKRREASLKTLNDLISKGYRSPGWDFSENVKRAIDEGHPDPDKLAELAKIISEETI